MMSLLHELKNGGQLEVGGFLSDLSDVEAMRSPFMAPSKPPSPSAALSRKPAFMEHNAAALKTVGLLAACPAPWKDATTSSDTSPLDSEDAMGLSKWIITAAELTASGLSTSSAITKFKIRGRLSTATQSFTNFEAGLKRVTYTTPGCGGIGNAAGDCGTSSSPTAAQIHIS
jgi:hypothetical protein